MRIRERYASAVNSSNLQSRQETTFSDSDVLAAMGHAARYMPLGVALQRLFVEGKPKQCVAIMADMVLVRSAKSRVRVSPTQAVEIAQKVLAWYRFGTCTDCGGTGKEVVFEPRPHLSDEDCHVCRGTGRRPFQNAFKEREMELAMWLSGQVRKEQAEAAREAMIVIAPSLDL